MRPHQLMDELRLWNITGWVGSEGRAQNIAPLHLIRCLIAGYDLEGHCRGGRKILRPYKWRGIVAIDAIEDIVAVVAIDCYRG